MKNKKVLFLILIVGMISAITLGSVLVSENVKRRLSENLINQFYTQEEVIAEQTSLTIQNEIANVIDKLYILSELPQVRYGNTEECNTTLADVSKNATLKVGNLGRVNKDGFFQCSLNKSLIGLKAEKLGPYITQIFNDPEHKPVASKAIVPPGLNSHIIGIHVPVYGKQNEFIGTVGGAIYLEDLGEKILKNIKLTPGGTFILLDDDGTVIYHPLKQLIGENGESEKVQILNQYEHSYKKILDKTERGVSGTIRYTFDGVEKLAAFAPVYISPGHNWTAIVTVPLSDVNQNLVKLGVGKFFTTALFLQTLIVVLVILFFSSFMMRQFKKEEQVNKAKDEFISLASHQLRTPLTAIRLYVEMLLDGHADQKDAPVYLKAVYDSTIRMIELVADFLNVSRIQMGSLKVSPEPSDLSKEIKNIIGEVQPLADKKGIHFDTKIPDNFPLVNIDRSLVRQVIHNILTNAVRYSPQSGKIEVMIEKPEDFLVTIKDSGIGIPVSVQHRIFERFYRAENAVHVEGEGSGLGLYMSKMIMDRLGGKIWFLSEESKGSTFYVMIPLKGVAATPSGK